MITVSTLRVGKNSKSHNNACVVGTLRCETVGVVVWGAIDIEADTIGLTSPAPRAAHARKRSVTGVQDGKELPIPLPQLQHGTVVMAEPQALPIDVVLPDHNVPGRLRHPVANDLPNEQAGSHQREFNGDAPSLPAGRLSRRLRRARQFGSEGALSRPESRVHNKLRSTWSRRRLGDGGILVAMLAPPGGAMVGSHSAKLEKRTAG